MDMTQQKVTCLMESSIDGRLDESRWSVLYDIRLVPKSNIVSWPTRFCHAAKVSTW